MRAFFTQRLGSNKELRTQLEKADADPFAAQKAIVDEGRLLEKVEKERETMRTEACRVKAERGATEAKCKEVEQEKKQLHKEFEELRALSTAHKKEIKELQAKFAAEKKELVEDYHKQVDDMFFFGYQCCMRKNDITQDIPSYPSDEKFGD